MGGFLGGFPAVEAYTHEDPYCDHLEDIFGDLADFYDGKHIEKHTSFADAVEAGWAGTPLT